jgi:hypothetical protein
MSVTPPEDVAGEELIRVLRSILEAHFRRHMLVGMRPETGLQEPGVERKAIIDAMVSDLSSFLADWLSKHGAGLAPGPSREAVDVSAPSASEADSRQGASADPSSS